jgi:hypothetical protein
VFKHRLDDRYFFACANDVRRGAVAEQESHCPDHNRFTRSGFACHDIETGLEGDFQRLDDRQIPDVQISQHMGRLPEGVRRGTPMISRV